MLPWPSTPLPAVQHMQQAAEMRTTSHAQHTTTSAQPVPSPPGGRNAEDTQSCPNETGPSLTPLFSYISQGMDTLLTTMQHSQAAAHEVVMKEIVAMWQELNASNAAPRSSNSKRVDDTETISGIRLPSKRARKSRNPAYFIPFDPDAPPTPKDFQEHKDFLVRIDIFVGCSIVLIQESFTVTGCYPSSRALSL